MTVNRFKPVANGRNFEGYGNTRLCDETRVIELRPLVLPAILVGIIACAVIVAVMAMAS